MRHYEIVLLIHPDFSDQIVDIIDRYSKMIIDSGGKIHRVEHWGNRQLAYEIKKLNKAYYILLNIEVSQQIVSKLNNDFKFNEIILRNIILRTKQAVTDPSPMMIPKEDHNKNYNNVSESHM